MSSWRAEHLIQLIGPRQRKSSAGCPAWYTQIGQELQAASCPALSGIHRTLTMADPLGPPQSMQMGRRIPPSWHAYRRTDLQTMLVSKATLGVQTREKRVNPSGKISHREWCSRANWSLLHTEQCPCRIYTIYTIAKLVFPLVLGSEALNLVASV